MKKSLNFNKTYLIASIIISSSLTPLAHAQMVPGYKGASNSLQVPSHAKDIPPPSTTPTLQSPSLPDRGEGYIKNPMPSSVAPKMITPPPSNKVMEVDKNHIVSQINDMVNESDERINKISLGNEKFPSHKSSMTELERDLDYDHRLREMSYLQKLSENGMKLFNTTYDGKREWAYEQNNNQNTSSPPTYNSSNSSANGEKSKSSFDSDADRLQIEHERSLLEKSKLEEEKKQMEKAKVDAENKAEKHKKDLEIAKKRMKEATPDPKVTMIYGNGVLKADILVPYYGRVVGLKKGDTITGENPMTITSIGNNTVKTKDEKGIEHILVQGDTVPKVKPSISKFMPQDEE